MKMAHLSAKDSKKAIEYMKWQVRDSIQTGQSSCKKFLRQLLSGSFDPLNNQALYTGKCIDL